MNLFYFDLMRCRHGSYRGQAVFDPQNAAIISSPIGYVPCGAGTLNLPDRASIRVPSSTGMFNGYGHLKTLNGDYYKGEFVNDVRHGIGESYQALSQRHYNGGFRVGIEEGYAVITKVDSEKNGGRKRYEGEVRNGRRHGRGKLSVTQLDGQTASLEGTWVTGLLHGPGNQISVNGPCFQGISSMDIWRGTGRARLRMARLMMCSSVRVGL